MKRIVEEAQRMIAVRSISSNGNEEIASLCEAMMQDRGMKTHLQSVTHSMEGVSKRQYNVIGALGDPLVDRKTRKGLLLLTHLDTSPHGELVHWVKGNQNPFHLADDGENCIGLGAGDAKLDFLCKLHAVERFRGKKLKQPVYMVGTCGKDLGMFGARYLLQSLAVNPQSVLVGAPTGLSLVVSHKATASFRLSVGYQAVDRDSRGFNRRVNLTVGGRIAHAAEPSRGTNAALILMSFLGDAMESGFEFRFSRFESGAAPGVTPDRAQVEMYLTTHQFEDFKRFFREKLETISSPATMSVEYGGLGDIGMTFIPEAVFPIILDVLSSTQSHFHELESTADEFFDPPTSTFSLRQVVNGPQKLELVFDVFLLPEMEIEKFSSDFKKLIQSVSSRYPNANLLFQREIQIPSLNVPAEDVWLKDCGDILSSADIPPVVVKQSTPTEAGLFQTKGFPVLAFGPGKGNENAHCPDEGNTWSEVEAAIRFYERIIEKVCL